jgi:hypothetical protein
MVLYINLVISYLISFPLMMGEGKDGGGRPGPYPPPESSPTVGGGTIFWLNWGYTFKSIPQKSPYGFLINGPIS